MDRDRIISVMEDKGWNQSDLARMLGVQAVVVNRWVNGKAKISHKKAQALQELLDRPENRAPPPASATAEIPIYDLTVTMGDGGFNGDNPEIISKIPFPEDFLMDNLHAKAQDLFCTKVVGDSMEPFARSGDLIIVDRSKTTPGDGYYVLNIDGALLFKKIQFMPGRLRIISENADYETYSLTEEDGVEVAIVGRAIFCMRYL
jgi:phage repressor protein C with HTH and peptisase S24 domain